jgi:hypothetical protein
LFLGVWGRLSPVEGASWGRLSLAMQKVAGLSGIAERR